MFFELHCEIVLIIGHRDAQGGTTHSKSHRRHNMENAINLDQSTFAGLADINRDALLRQIFVSWKVQTELEHEAMLKALHTTDEGERIVAQDDREYRGGKRQALEDIMITALTFNKKGEYKRERLDDACQSLALTRENLCIETQQAFFEKMEAEKEAKLKEEYMAGFDAWKATKVSA